MTDLPVACSLTTAERACQADDLLPGLVASAEERQVVPGGLRWRFRTREGLLGRIGRVIDAERRCCRFLRFTVTAEPDGGSVWVEATGPEGTRAFLARLTS